jgi:putative tricarboxylic transport membrane protein
MRKKSLVLIIAMAMVAVSVGSAMAEFPARPITLVVYMAPGGAIDVFARKFEAIAKKYSDATFVIINKPGAGGIVAIKDILAGKADGYKLAAVTKSNIGKLVSVKSNINIDDMSWLAMMVSDPEAIITNRNLAVNTWEQIVDDAKAKNGDQIWVGPAKGGNDHIMAMKVWKAAGIKGKWIPYDSGGKAMTALMGGHGLVYVGNPQDVIGKPDLKVAVISSAERLGGEFSDSPTFKELGISGLDDEIMWRGFMVKKGIPEEARNFYNDLFEKVNKDPDWQNYIKKGGANPVFYSEEKFTGYVKTDQKDFTESLKELGILK